MAEITAKAVAELRAKTGCGMMDCKKALKETDGNFDAAIKYLRERGLAVAAKKADRIAAEGIVAIMKTGNTAAMIEVNSETDFVAKNADFQSFVSGLLSTILNVRPADVDVLMAAKYTDSEFTVEATIKDKVFTTGENLNIRRFLIVDGYTSTYVHGKGQTGVIVKFNTDENIASTEGFAEYAKNVALQVAALPSLYVSKKDVPESVIDEEKEILMTQIRNDKTNVKKSQAIIEKMVMGRLGKFYEANCLVEQLYVKDDSLTIGKYPEAVAKQLGGTITIDSFYRYEKGEGLQKREDNFAEEIANMIK
jgi:elongation factor Ts